MNNALEEVVECHKCNAKVVSRVWNIHEIMCKRAQTLPKKPKKQANMLSLLFGMRKEEEVEDQEPVIPCLECGESFPFSLYALHQQECIGHQLTLCQGCGLKFPTFLFEEHTQVCEGGHGDQEDEGIQMEQNQGEDQVLQALISNIAIREVSEEEGLTKSQLANLTPHISSQVEDCPICCTEMRHKKHWLIKLNCKHVYHRSCINAWLAKNPLCPMCRTHALKK